MQAYVQIFEHLTLRYHAYNWSHFIGMCLLWIRICVQIIHISHSDEICIYKQNFWDSVRVFCLYLKMLWVWNGVQMHMMFYRLMHLYSQEKLAGELWIQDYNRTQARTWHEGSQPVQEMALLWSWERRGAVKRVKFFKYKVKFYFKGKGFHLKISINPGLWKSPLFTNAITAFKRKLCPPRTGILCPPSLSGLSARCWFFGGTLFYSPIGAWIN